MQTPHEASVVVIISSGSWVILMTGEVTERQNSNSKGRKKKKERMDRSRSFYCTQKP